jgi:hypothetical protein
MTIPSTNISTWESLILYLQCYYCKPYIFGSNSRVLGCHLSLSPCPHVLEHYPPQRLPPSHIPFLGGLRVSACPHLATRSAFPSRTGQDWGLQGRRKIWRAEIVTPFLCSFHKTWVRPKWRTEKGSCIDSLRKCPIYSLLHPCIQRSGVSEFNVSWRHQWFSSVQGTH